MKRTINGLFAVVGFVAMVSASLGAQETQGPFGFQMGMTTAQLAKIGTLKPVEGMPKGVYSMTTAPAPRSDFETYDVLVSPITGLCKIMAIGADVQSGGGGMELRSAFNGLHEALDSKYGKASNDFDNLQDGSIWNDDNDFMMGLAVRDRHLMSFWGGQEGNMKTPNHVANVELEARASSAHRGWVVLSYEFENATPCIQQMQAQKNGIL